jgi:hypothetical protein
MDMNEQFVDDIKSILNDRDVLKRALEEPRRAKIQGDSAQQETAKVINNHNALYRICQHELHSRESADYESVENAIKR